MIKFLIMDVDGTLTDGKIYMGDNGEMFKAFDVKDGCGIKDILPRYGIVPIIITARKSRILERRCEELHVKNVFQDIREKKEKLSSIIALYNEKHHMKYRLKDCAYIGDDILDLQCIEPIKAEGGLIGCPSDAVDEVISLADYVCTHSGGNGAVREFIEWIVR